MQQIEYLEEQGSFSLRNAERYRNLYFPLVNEGGMISSVTPLLDGDCKSGQDTFLLAPASEDSLRSGRDSRNFWVCTSAGAWSVTGQSAPQQAACFEEGGEAVAALFFQSVLLLPGESRRYQIVLAIDDSPAPYLTPDGVEAAFERTKAWWQSLSGLSFHTGNRRFDAWMRWVAVQPVLRRICGCSFLSHHDYGRGGRGWRDLWQDSLALLLSKPEDVRGDLISYFGGVRTDGTNATIIGSVPGEFRADRNNIPRVWMDHGFWPLLTVALYLDETGDDAFLLEEGPYFADAFPWRGQWQRGKLPEASFRGTVLEHLLVQTVTAFYDVGEHGHMRLRGADWNDGLDMAGERGESVAFTAAYAYGFGLLARMTRRLAEKGTDSFAVSGALAALLGGGEEQWGDQAAMQEALLDYCAGADRVWEPCTVGAAYLTGRLRAMARWLREHIAATEWTGDGVKLSWYNSYYDNSGRQVEGLRGRPCA